MKRGHRHISTEYWAALWGQGAREEILKSLALPIPTDVVFENVRTGSLSAREGAELMAFKRQAEWDAQPWPIRMLRWLLRYGLGWSFMYTEKESDE